MSTVDMMILGVLMEGPMNAYEMKKILESRNVKAWAKLSSPAIYKNLLKLYHSGYIDGEVVRDGGMPEKTIYTINENGKKYFGQLLKHFSDEPGVVYIEFASFISNLNYVEKAEGLEMLENLHAKIRAERDKIQRYNDTKSNGAFYAVTLLELYLQMYEGFDHWIEDFKIEYKEKQ